MQEKRYVLCMIIECIWTPRFICSEAFRAFWKRTRASAIGLPAPHRSWLHAHYLLGISMLDRESSSPVQLKASLWCPELGRIALPPHVSMFQGSSQCVRSREPKG